jgi:hypothetical protein
MVTKDKPEKKRMGPKPDTVIVSNGNGNKCCQNKKLFIQKYPEYGSIGETLRAIGLKERKTFYKWLATDANFNAIYYHELLPNRRDTVQSVVYRMATANKSVAICPVCEGSGKYEGTKNCHGCHGKGWVEVHADTAQLTAAFGFLKASDHAADDNDKLVFIERNQVQLTGEGGGPVLIKEVEVRLSGDSNSG